MYKLNFLSQQIIHVLRIIKRQDMKLIQGIVDECDQYSNSSLMQIIFKQSPYRNVYQKYFHNTISNKTLKDFFEEE